MRADNAQESEYLNLAHQFLDDNFVEITSSDSFARLPLISSDIRPSGYSIDIPRAVDYFSDPLTEQQYHSCWKSIADNKFMKPYELSNIFNLRSLKSNSQIEDIQLFLPCTSAVRLENACWRAWAKVKHNLGELDPAEINWNKENDITALYGPVIEKKNTTPKPQYKHLYTTPEEFADVAVSDEEMCDDEYLSDSSFTRTMSFDSTDSAATSVASVSSTQSSPCLKKPLMVGEKRKANKKRVSFASKVDRREIVGGTFYDCVCNLEA